MGRNKPHIKIQSQPYNIQETKSVTYTKRYAIMITAISLSTWEEIR